MADIRIVDGDIFESGADIILHQVNCQGVMGSGIARQVRERYPWVYGEYRNMCHRFYLEGNLLLGSYQRVFIDERRSIINVFGQDKFGYDGKCYTDYDKLKRCLKSIVRDEIEDDKSQSVAIPYLMGCHRGGGDWNVVYKIIQEVFEGYNVTLYRYSE